MIVDSGGGGGPGVIADVDGGRGPGVIADVGGGRAPGVIADGSGDERVQRDREAVMTGNAVLPWLARDRGLRW